MIVVELVSAPSRRRCRALIEACLRHRTTLAARGNRKRLKIPLPAAADPRVSRQSCSPSHRMGGRRTRHRQRSSGPQQHTCQHMPPRHSPHDSISAISPRAPCLVSKKNLSICGSCIHAHCPKSEIGTVLLGRGWGWGWGWGRGWGRGWARLG